MSFYALDKAYKRFHHHSMVGWACLGDGSNAPSLGRGEHNIDGRVVPLPSTAAHEPIAVKKPLWTRWKSLPQTQNVAPTTASSTEVSKEE